MLSSTAVDISVHVPSGTLEDTLKLTQLVPRNVDRKLGVSGANELGINTKRLGKLLADNIRLGDPTATSDAMAFTRPSRVVSDGASE